MSEMRSKGLFDRNNLVFRKTLSDRACYTGSRSPGFNLFGERRAKLASAQFTDRREWSGLLLPIGELNATVESYKHDRRVRNAEPSVGIKECGLDRYRQLRRWSD